MTKREIVILIGGIALGFALGWPSLIEAIGSLRSLFGG